ncbi:HECT-type E3 ubiquitin transferase [Sarracenia purpurea var. burkii]
MSRVETSIDSIHARLDRLSFKRKLDEYGATDDGDSSSDLISVRMRKDEPNAVNTTSTNQITPPYHTNQQQQQWPQQQQSLIESRVSDARSLLFSSPTDLRSIRPLPRL